MNQFMIIIAIAVIAVVILRRVVPLVASGIAIALTSAVAVWGTLAYRDGGGLQLGTLPMTQGVFYGLIGLVIGLECLNMWRRIKAKRRAREEAEAEARAAGQEMPTRVPEA